MITEGVSFNHINDFFKSFYINTLTTSHQSQLSRHLYAVFLSSYTVLFMLAYSWTLRHHAVAGPALIILH